jgi:2-dehydropantoate 2-reductase
MLPVGDPPRVLVVGTGAMASFFAARLQRHGDARVSMTGGWREALATISDRGVEVEDGSGSWSAYPEVVPQGGGRLPVVDLILVLVKAHQTAGVAPMVGRALGPTSHVLTLQNGLGNCEALEAAAGRHRVSVGVATVGATLLAPGRVRATPTGSVALGAGAAPPPRLLDLARLLEASGFEMSLERDVQRMVWRKLVVNCAINPLSAILGCLNGGLLESLEPRTTLLQAAGEVGAVAGALGIELGADPAALVLAVAERTAANRSSMLQDVTRGARTEIEALSGAVVREGQRLGVPVPVNEGLWRRIRALETAARRATA